MSLRNILNTQIDKYFQEDNIEPKAWWHCPNIFSTSGSAGRTRAKAYRNVISNTDPDGLLLKVYQDLIEDDGELGSSKKLRNRLCRGLCYFYNITDKQIDSAIENFEKSFTRGVAQTGAVVPVTEDRFDIKVMCSLLAKHIQPLLAAQKKTKPLASLTYHDEL